MDPPPAQRKRSNSPVFNRLRTLHKKNAGVYPQQTRSIPVKESPKLRAVKR